MRTRLHKLFILVFVISTGVIWCRWYMDISTEKRSPKKSSHVTVSVKPAPKTTSAKDESCIVEHMTSNSKDKNGKKTIFYLGDLWQGMGRILQFDGCEYSNCIYQTCNNFSYLPLADAVVFAHDSKYAKWPVATEVRQRQLWFVYGVEPPAFEWSKWPPIMNSMNGTMTYLHSSYPASFAYGTISRRNTSQDIAPNYAKNKIKGAFVYVSNCESQGYNRLDAIKQLSNFIDVDVYGKCGKSIPCTTRFDDKCEAHEHSQYRFYLAFENSLCSEYITEKFWRILVSDGYFIPVALGGLSMNEYTNTAPPNSFIHAYNFTSIEKLGLYLKLLMTDDAAFNSYHQWRQYYQATRIEKQEEVCKVCEAINEPELLHVNRGRKFADEWNKESNCRTF